MKKYREKNDIDINSTATNPSSKDKIDIKKLSELIQVEEKVLEICRSEYYQLRESMKFLDQKFSYSLVLIAALFAFHVVIFQNDNIWFIAVIFLNIIASILTIIGLLTQSFKKINVDKLVEKYIGKTKYYNLVSSLKNSYKFYNIYNGKKLKLKGRLYKTSNIFILIQFLALIAYFGYTIFRP